MHSRKASLWAYLYLPVAYILLGIGLVALLLTPFWDMLRAAGNMLFSGASLSTQVDTTSFQAFDPAASDLSGNTYPEEDVVWPVWGQQYATLACTKAGLDTAVFWGDDKPILRAGAGTYIGSGLPGGGRVMLISGHCSMYFSALQYLSVGDVITFTTSYAQYEYQVTDIQVLQANDPNAFDLLKEEEQLILYTCYPFTALGYTSQRCFIYAQRISGPDLV